MNDALQVVSIITSLLQGTSNSIQSAALVSNILSNMLNAGRTDATTEEWHQIDAYVAQAREDAVKLVS
jgi:hypothetical protein